MAKNTHSVNMCKLAIVFYLNTCFCIWICYITTKCNKSYKIHSTYDRTEREFVVCISLKPWSVLPLIRRKKLLLSDTMWYQNILPKQTKQARIFSGHIWLKRTWKVTLNRSVPSEWPNHFAICTWTFAQKMGNCTKPLLWWTIDMH